MQGHGPRAPEHGVRALWRSPRDGRSRIAGMDRVSLRISASRATWRRSRRRRSTATSRRRRRSGAPDKAGRRERRGRRSARSPAARLSAATARAMAQQGCAADIVGVDLLDAGEDERNASALAKMIGRRSSRRAAVSAFESSRPSGQIARIENHRRDADRTRERAAADLVDAGDAAAAPRRSPRARNRSAARSIASAPAGRLKVGRDRRRARREGAR